MLMEENEDLKSKITILEKHQRNEDIQRDKFYEGAVWAAKQCVGECEKSLDKAKILTKVGGEYEKRMKECGSDDFLKMRNNEWVVDQSVRLV